MTSSVIGLRRSSKVLPKAKLTLKKGHGHCLLVWSTTTVWILVKPWHLRSVLSKSKRYTESCSACSWHRSAERARFFSVTVPNCMSHTCASSWMNWATKFCLICHIHLAFCQPTTISWSIYLCNFLQVKCFHNKSEAKSVFHEFVKSQSMDFYATRINQLIPCWQKCFDCSGSYFD